MKFNRFRHSSIVEAIVLGVIGCLVAAFLGFRQLGGLNGNPGGAVGHEETVVSASASVTTGEPTPTAVNSLTAVATSALPGEVLAVAAAPSASLTLVSTDQIPVTSQPEAMQAVYDRGVPWGLGDEVEGRTPNVVATFGLATFGSAASDGSWVGDRNIRLPTGEVLDHIEDRPVWILDYGNTVGYRSQATFNHTVYAVDDATGAVMLIWFYNNDTEPPTANDE